MTNYIPIPMKREITVDSIVTVHYLEHTKDYLFEGEKHNFWEILYCDKGTVEIIADEKGYELSQGQMVFHKPNEFHSLYANGTVAPNLVIVSFISRSTAMSFFNGKILYATQQQQDLLAQIIKEARQAFSCPLGDPSTLQMEISPEAPFGSQQLIQLYLEMFLIDTVRHHEAVKQPKISSTIKRRADNEMVDRVIRYMEEHICDGLTFSDVCRHSSESATNLKTIFKSVTGYGVMEKYRLLKIEKAKKWLREGKGNITQIADMLGYASVHYFSRHFKQATGMTPREYTLSVQAK